MHQGQTLKFVRGEGAPIKSPTFGGVIAALAAGSKFSGPDCLLDTIREVEGEPKEAFVWSFDGEAACTFEPKFTRETIEVNEIVRRFLDDKWCEANADHPIAYMRTFYDMRNDLVAQVKDRPRLEVIERVEGSRTSRCYIPENATPEERASILEEFNKP